MTEFLSQFEMNAELEISKTSGNQQGVWNSILFIMGMPVIFLFSEKPYWEHGRPPKLSH